LRITLLIPCRNEEKSIAKSIESWLAQTRPADEIIVVDDCSTDKTADILAKFKRDLKTVRTEKNLGKKSHAQQFGLQFVTGDIFIATDADTLLEPDFIERIEADFADPAVAAVGGYVRSLKYNWLTRHRAFEYAIGQNFHKLAQSYLNCMFVIPGAAGAFRTDIFRKYLSFEHDTIAEDLDFTYKLHKLGLKLLYDRKAVVCTQDPATMRGYINQMRRWFGGGWQNLIKHYNVFERPSHALELSLMYTEGLVFSTLMILVPILNIHYAVFFLFPYLCIAFVMSVYAAIKERRWDMLLVPIPYLFFLYLNAYIFMEQFVLEVVMHRKELTWFTPERTTIA
jgi:cellulose synthase/poly-beta-1,6-N-acetylglucosamine synthase-like glycosyltransferase